MEINVRGHEFHLRLNIVGYEQQQQGRDSYDDNWLSGTVTLEIHGSSATSFRAACDAAWQTTEFMRFHESLRTLLDDLTGTASFVTIEEQVELTIRLVAGKGEANGHVEAPPSARLEFAGETDQSYLQTTLDELRAVLAAYPFRQ